MDSGVVFKLYSAVKSYLVFRIALLSVKLVETLFNLARAEQMQFKTYKIMLCKKYVGFWTLHCPP